MAVPFIDLKRFEAGFLDKWAEKCRHISANTMFVGGPEGAALEKRLAEESGAAAVVGCANGTDALQLALRAAGVGAGDVVAIPDSTFWATFEAVVNVGARVVTVDIDLTDLQMDFDQFRRAIETYRPKAAILVHLYGWASARLDDFRAFCAEKGVKLIEDGAQSYAVTHNGTSVYKDAWMSTISFYPAKVLGSCGDAGAVYCSTKELAETVRLLGNHGRTSHYGHGLVGWNSRMGGFDAAFLNLSLEYAPARIASRRKSAEWLRETLSASGVRTVGPPAGYVENGYLNVTLQDPVRRPAIEAVLKENGIGFGNVYPGAMSKQPGAKDFLAGAAGGENADLLARSVLNLPLFAYMKPSELEEVVAVMEKALAVGVA
ncbi:DegT/DnrJ/EryC1/StrS family aminotransferase [Candidatus Poribacteria bacterium]|nr:DegT/DnrJ/EryC1/StrS family aminotransferase [Candidatus Poribacteria bacterium]